MISENDLIKKFNEIDLGENILKSDNRINFKDKENLNNLRIKNKLELRKKILILY